MGAREMPDGELILERVPFEFIDSAWDKGAKTLENALSMCGGECTIGQLKMMLSRGEMTLLYIRNNEKSGWIAGYFMQHPNMRVFHVYGICAPGVPAQNIFQKLIDYAKAGGASSIQGACSPAVARLWANKFQFKNVYSICRRDI